MTMGKVIECLIGKAAAISGDYLHGVDEQDFELPFEERQEVIERVLERVGFRKNGTETFIDGQTGQQIKVPIMCGIVAYAKLNHMVARKAHARATGPVHMLTRQPNEGRRQGGGLRFGQMESECVIAHSAAEILRERMLTASDKYTCYTCNGCGFIADANPAIDYYFCRVCRTGRHIKEIDIGFATKLMTQENMATGVKALIRTEDVQDMLHDMEPTRKKQHR